MSDHVLTREDILERDRAAVREQNAELQRQIVAERRRAAAWQATAEAHGSVIEAAAEALAAESSEGDLEAIALDRMGELDKLREIREAVIGWGRAQIAYVEGGGAGNARAITEASAHVQRLANELARAAGEPGAPPACPWCGAKARLWNHDLDRGEWACGSRQAGEVPTQSDPCRIGCLELELDTIDQILGGRDDAPVPASERAGRIEAMRHAAIGAIAMARGTICGPAIAAMITRALTGESTPEAEREAAAPFAIAKGMQRRAEWLARALRKYGDHHADCEGSGDGVCVCEWSAVEAELERIEGEDPRDVARVAAGWGDCPPAESEGQE